jgi:lipopolysaccharide/colanic/teichoic acid biosynthesis glycosyltransferase
VIAQPTVAFREDPWYRRSQRLFDLSIALVALLIALPVLLIAAIAIVAEDGGPVLFTQRRVGRFGKLFTIYKLRTMRQEQCGDAFSPRAANDKRITAVGRILRKTSIDELPQLVNVLRGEMAIVGPRPEMPFIVASYEPWQHLRHLAKPGITGLWQTSCRSRIPLHEAAATQLDLEYIRKASLRTDGSIVLRTVTSLLSTEGAY